MTEFAVTFPDLHRHTGHPVNKKAHPDGYAVVTAACIEDAQEIAASAYGPYWRAVVPAREIVESEHPLGCLMRLP